MEKDLVGGKVSCKFIVVYLSQQQKAGATGAW